MKNLQIADLKNRLAVRQHLCATLAAEFEQSDLTVGDKSVIATRWDSMLKESYLLQFVMDLVDRRARENRGEQDLNLEPTK